MTSKVSPSAVKNLAIMFVIVLLAAVEFSLNIQVMVICVSALLLVIVNRRLVGDPPAVFMMEG